jgi:hypothetical protein
MNARRLYQGLCVGAFALGLLGAVLAVSIAPRYGFLFALTCLGAAFAAAFLLQAVKLRSRLEGAPQSDVESTGDRRTRKPKDRSDRGLRSGPA